jgi:hypothetical protein
VADDENLIRTPRTDQAAAADAGEMGTNNFLIDLMEQYEKMAWMLYESIETQGRPAEGFLEETKQAGSSTWEESIREASGQASEPAPPAAPPPDYRWNDEKLYQRDVKSGEFTPGEMGQPDQEPKPDLANPQGAQGGRGPLEQEGEGNRQNDELAELQQDVDAKKDLEERR